MMRRTALLAVALAALLGAAPAVAQDPAWELTLVDGRVIGCTRVVLSEGGASFDVVTDGLKRSLPRDEILGIHGPAPRSSELAVVTLVGGDVLRGAVVGGDRGGDTFEILSPVLGRLSVEVDRLATILWRTDQASALDLRIPEGADEALFGKAGVGLDIYTGAIYRFGAESMRFAPEGEGEPRPYRYEDLVGLALRDGTPRPGGPPSALLVTRAGDRLRVDLRAMDENAVRVAFEGEAEIAVPVGDVAALTFFDGGRHFLADLEPEAVEEAGFSGPALYRFRRDANTTGGFLVADGRCHAKGLGVHSRSVLRFRVPEDSVHFHARVALDDAVRSLGPRPDVDVRVTLDGEVLFSRDGMRGGDAAVNLGLLTVRPGALLSLEVDFGKGQDLADRVDWLSAVFLPAPARE